MFRGTPATWQSCSREALRAQGARSGSREVNTPLSVMSCFPGSSDVREHRTEHTSAVGNHSLHSRGGPQAGADSTQAGEMVQRQPCCAPLPYNPYCPPKTGCSERVLRVLTGTTQAGLTPTVRAAGKEHPVRADELRMGSWSQWQKMVSEGSLKQGHLCVDIQTYIHGHVPLNNGNTF